jgi:hypothetical protein
MRNGEWVVDLERRVCRNTVNRVAVRFSGGGAGRIVDMPLELLSELARTSGGAGYLGRLIREAERVFVPALIQARMTGN